MMGEMHPAILTVRSAAPPPPHPELCSGFSGAAARPRRSSPSLLWRPTEREAAPSGGRSRAQPCARRRLELEEQTVFATKGQQRRQDRSRFE